MQESLLLIFLSNFGNIWNNRKSHGRVFRHRLTFGLALLV